MSDRETREERGAAAAGAALSRREEPHRERGAIELRSRKQLLHSISPTLIRSPPRPIPPFHGRSTEKHINLNFIYVRSPFTDTKILLAHKHSFVLGFVSADRARARMHNRRLKQFSNLYRRSFLPILGSEGFQRILDGDQVPSGNQVRLSMR